MRFCATAGFLLLSASVLTAVGCGSTERNLAPNATAAEVLPFTVIIDGKEARFDPESFDKYKVYDSSRGGSIPVAYIEGDVAANAAIQIKTPGGSGELIAVRIFAREINEQGRTFGKPVLLMLKNPPNEGKLNLKEYFDYLIQVEAYVESGGQVLPRAFVRIKTRPKV